MTEAQKIAKEVKESRKGTSLLLSVAALASFLALGLAGWSFIDRFHETTQKRAEQAQLNARLTMLGNSNCQDIEALKTAQRDQENQDFRDLHRNLRLLGIKETPAILRAASRHHSRQLARFKPEACPRKLNRR